MRSPGDGCERRYALAYPRNRVPRFAVVVGTAAVRAGTTSALVLSMTDTDPTLTPPTRPDPRTDAERARDLRASEAETAVREYLAAEAAWAWLPAPVTDRAAHNAAYAALCAAEAKLATFGGLGAAIDLFGNDLYERMRFEILDY